MSSSKGVPAIKRMSPVLSRLSLYFLNITLDMLYFIINKFISAHKYTSVLSLLLRHYYIVIALIKSNTEYILDKKINGKSIKYTLSVIDLIVIDNY